MKHILTICLLAVTMCAAAQEKRFAMSTPKAVEGNVSKFEAGAFASELQKALTNNGYRVVARGPAVDAIIKDFDFESNSSLTDNEKAKLAQLKNVDYICMPAVMEKNGIYYFSATVIDKELGEFVAVVSAFLKNFSDIDSACEQMAGEILSYLGASSDDSYTRPQYPGGNGSSHNGGQSQTFTVNGVSFKMISVKGGTFTMGGTYEQGGETYDDEKPTHSVTLSDYCIGETEVTQALWTAVMGSNPSGFKGDNLPVESVSWYDVEEFLTKLNQKTGRFFRLPTEAEWEYAARGGNKSQSYKYSGSNNLDFVAWYGNANGHTHDVKSKQPNELGIYDMSGNVWEWCADWYGNYSNYSQTNPTGPSSGSGRVLRGGSWNYGARDCRVSNRLNFSPDYRNSNRGFRLVLVP